MSEVSSYCHHRYGDGDDKSSELDLALGLTLACGGAGIDKRGRSSAVAVKQHARIWTSKDLDLDLDLPSCGLLSSSSSSTSSLSSTSSCSAPSLEQSKGAGTKRSADSLVTTANVRQAVGWPPVAAYRINNFVNQAKLLSQVEYNSACEKSKNNNPSLIENPKFGCEKNNGDCMESKNQRLSTLVKVSMDGFPYGRKVHLNAHSCYEALSQTLEEMFCMPHTGDATRASGDERNAIAKARRTSKLLDGSSEFVLTYEDKDGDLMLVGDVPWRMFLNSVKRLRIMWASEANGLARSKK